MAKQIQDVLAILLLVVIATLTASAAVTAEAASKMKEYYISYKNKDKNKRV
jgi:outer membrane lipoprotein-sorting protein